MCNFHSILGVSLAEGQYEIIHNPGNSHSEMAGVLTNKPFRKPIIFEAEWDGEGAIPDDTNLIRHCGECPERMAQLIRSHYQKLKEAITTGKHLDSYFRDTKKYADVWNKAIENGAPVALPAVFEGNLAVSDSAKLDAPALTEVGGNLTVSDSAKLEALTKVGGHLDVYGSAKLDAPALTEVGGYLTVSGSAKLDAPKLKSVNGKSYKK